MRSQDVRRLLFAFAIAIAVHEVLAAFITWRAPETPAEAAIVAHVTIARIVHTPSPKPSPTPTPPPQHLFHPAQVAAGVHARVEQIKHAGAKRPTPPKIHQATPVPALPTGGQGAGAQNGAGAGSLSDFNGNGSGTGAAGNGNGASICGAVDFEAKGNAVLDPATGYYERDNIVATVYYADGSFEKIPLDWSWTFKSEDQDPFNAESDAPLLFQFPPAGKRASEPAPIQYIIAHTRPNGRTVLNDKCPNIPAAPAVNSSSNPDAR